MKTTRVLTVILTLATLVLGFATNAEARWQFPWNRAKAAATQPATVTASDASGTSVIPADTPAPVPEAKAVDPLARLLTSATFVKHANESLATAAPDDVAFRQCVQFGLALGQELAAKPLLTAPTLALPQLSILSADKSCPLCIIAAKRKDLEMLQAGGPVAFIAAINAQAAEIKARAIDINKRLNLACAPLANSETNVAGQILAMFGG